MFSLLDNLDQQHGQPTILSELIVQRDSVDIWWIKNISGIGS